MSKSILFIFFCLSSCTVSSQNWQQIGDFNDTPRVTFNDTISDLLYHSGNFRFNGIDTVDGFCAYNGSTFTSFGRRFDCTSFGCSPAFLIARYKDQIYFSGPALSIIDGVSDINGIAKWDGMQWSPAMPGLVYEVGDNPYLDSYYIRNDLFYAVGFFRTADGDTCNSVAYWNGQKWTGLNFPPWSDNSLPRVTSVIFYQDQLYVGGNFSWAQSGGADIARLDSTGWHMVGGGLYGGLANVNDMVVYKNELYICGYFRELDGNIGNKIMRWDGVQWKKVGEGFCAPNVIPAKMMVHEDKLYVVGIFYCVENDLPVHNIATWDGERWCTFGNSVFNNKINYISAYKGDIYISGGFTEVDGQPCKYFAKWIGDHSTDICSEPVSSAQEPSQQAFNIWPNPATSILQIQAPAPLEFVQVYDAMGRVVLQSTVGNEVSVAHLPAGLYFVSARARGTVWGARFVKE
ncbi:MAG: T9SS type A sorting domain-containing protein [Chitinophagales bacterium]|nr:T9SS type A sorting domain-containing protein [Chitinophagales bacterium]